MAVAGILLTGGASTRMGFDKAGLRSAGSHENLAQRTARLLSEVAGPCLEVGPGRSGLRAVEESPPRSGPLVALAQGWGTLTQGSGAPATESEAAAGSEVLAAGSRAPATESGAPAPGWEASAVLVVATDLPALTADSLRWLASYPGASSVVPLVDGRPQPLCARWSAGDLDTARVLVAQGRRALRDLIAEAAPLLVDPDEAGGPGAAPFGDADTPDQAQALGLCLP